MNKLEHCTAHWPHAWQHWGWLHEALLLLLLLLLLRLRLHK
jgi:hypothetical protein